MSWLGDAFGWIKDNKDIIEPAATFGFGALQQVNKDNTESQYLDYLRQKEQQNFQDSSAAIDAYNQQAQAAAGAAQANAAARASAARATEANRQAAAKKANKVDKKTYKDILKMYAPYRQTANQLLPQMQQTYQNSLGLQNALAQYVNSPAQVAKLDAAVPAYNVNIPLPDYVRQK